MGYLVIYNYLFDFIYYFLFINSYLFKLWIQLVPRQKNSDVGFASVFQKPFRT